MFPCDDFEKVAYSEFCQIFDLYPTAIEDYRNLLLTGVEDYPESLLEFIDVTRHDVYEMFDRWSEKYHINDFSEYWDAYFGVCHWGDFIYYDEFGDPHDVDDGLY